MVGVDFRLVSLATPIESRTRGLPEPDMNEPCYPWLLGIRRRARTIDQLQVDRHRLAPSSADG
jgi:hypothetical protein